MYTPEQIWEKLRSRSVGIAGCGGLGSNCAVALARIGIGRLIIVDFDVISISNLNRQYYFRDQVGRRKVDALKENIRRIREDVQVEAHALRLDPPSIIRFFSPCDVIVEAFDQAEMKRMLIETVLEKMPRTPLVSALGLAGYGHNNDMRTVCLGNLYICGDQQREVSERMPPLAPRVGIAAHLQANQVVDILLGHPPSPPEGES